jgi:D-3-phosphoglycerate dehydrogenase
LQAGIAANGDTDGYIAEIDRALDRAHVVSLHLGLNDETAGILDARRLSLAVPGYILVNTARAGLVDQEAMLAALRDGYIGHAALDVFPAEPLLSGNQYLLLPNATFTAHAAYMTEVAYVELWKRTIKCIDIIGSTVLADGREAL